MTIDIVAARKIIDAATPGPFTAEKETHDAGKYKLLYVVVNDAAGANLIRLAGTDDNQRLARFIAAARLGWPAALDEIESLRKQVAERDATIAELRAALSGLCRVVTYIHGVNPLDLRLQDTFNRSKAILAKTTKKEGT